MVPESGAAVHPAPRSEEAEDRSVSVEDVVLLVSWLDGEVHLETLNQGDSR